MVLTTAERKALSDSDFALPGRRYPIQDEAHARAALARVSEFGSAKEQQIVRSKIQKRYTNMKLGK